MKKILITILIIVLCIAFAAGAVWAAYYSRGAFKDVFVNKQEYFSSDVMNRNNPSIKSNGGQRTVFLYNHDLLTGDYNSFDLTYDVYAWLSKEYPNGIANYSVNDKEISYNSDYSTPESIPANKLFSDTLEGGKRSTKGIEINFEFTSDQQGIDEQNLPVLYLLAVPTDPPRMTSDSFRLGVQISPTQNKAFRVNGSFEQHGKVSDNAAFVYNVTTEGADMENIDKLILKWNPQKLTLKRMNDEEITTTNEGSYEFDAKIENTDKFVFIRKPTDSTGSSGWGDEIWNNTSNGTQNITNPDNDSETGWEQLEQLVEVKIKNDSGNN